jgi:hypothetical protein
MARNEALMEELKAHFRDNGEQVKLLTGRIDWQQKSLQGSVSPSPSDPLDSTANSMSQILQSGECRIFPCFERLALPLCVISPFLSILYLLSQPAAAPPFCCVCVCACVCVCVCVCGRGGGGGERERGGWKWQEGGKYGY